MLPAVPLQAPAADMSRLRFSIASTDDEFEQVHRLNHDTFCLEIPQHPARSDGRMVDRFHAENLYVVGKCGDEVVAMVALRDRRPFSLDAKLPSLDDWLPPDRCTGEVRLLAIRPRHRHRGAIAGLMRELWRTAHSRGLDLLLISGTTRQLKLYRQLGFEPFGPRVGSVDAEYQPMLLRREALNTSLRSVAHARPAGEGLAAAPFSPSLPRVVPAVLQAAAVHPRAHRGRTVMATLRRIRERLCAATGAEDVQVLAGTGTLANDAIAAQLARRPGRGLVLVNGEFGERLAAHVSGAAAAADVVRVDWGQAFDFPAIAASLAGQRPAWAWMVHCETSTGRLNDVDGFRALCERLGCLPVLDCVSSIGNLPVALDGIGLASGVSGKGLAALTGLALVFHRADALVAARLPGMPRCLDLAWYREQDGIAWSLSSNLLDALDRAIEQCRWMPASSSAPSPAPPAPGTLHRAVVSRLAAGGLRVLVADESAAPFLVTVELPGWLDAAAVGAAMQRAGSTIAWESRYLRERNWVQLAWMGRRSEHEVLAAADALVRCCRQQALVQDLPPLRQRTA